MSTASGESAISSTTAERATTIGDSLVKYVLFPFAMVGAPLFIGSMLSYQVIVAFLDGAGSGMRSSAAALLPFMAVVYLITFRSGTLQNTMGEKVKPGVAFTLMFLIGLATMQILSLGTGQPIVELFLAACLSALLGASVEMHRDEWGPYYFGCILGLLSYVVFLGLPQIG